MRSGSRPWAKPTAGVEVEVESAFSGRVYSGLPTIASSFGKTLK
jgi:hypothetical protein